MKMEAIIAKLSEQNRRNVILQIIVGTIAFILMLQIWPCGTIKNHTISSQQAVSISDRDTWSAFTKEDKKLQTVIFSHEHLYEVTMYLDCLSYREETFDTSLDNIYFRIYDSEFSCIYEESYACKRIAKDGLLIATPDMDVEVGVPYYYEVIIPEDSQAKLAVPIAPNSLLSQTENGALYIDGIINEEYSLVSDFDYTSRLSLWQIVLYYMIVILGAVIVYYAFIRLSEYMEAHAPSSLSFKWAVTFISVAIAIALVIPLSLLNVFSGEIADRLVYMFGIVGGLLWILAGTWNFKYNHFIKSLKEEADSLYAWRNYIQIVSFGLLFYALCQYVNADRLFYQWTNTRWMLIFLGIALLMIDSLKRFLEKINIAWLVLATIGSIIYCLGFSDEQEFHLAKLSAAVVVIWGLVIINVVKRVKPDTFLCVDKAFFAIWLVFAAIMWYYRFDKTWPITATLPFLIIVLYGLNRDEKAEFMQNFTRGILLSFGMVMAFCLVHRPYLRFIFLRYNGIFHTVACFGMYLALVFAAALGKFFVDLKNKRPCTGDMFVVTVVFSVTMLSMTRTALLAEIVTLLLVGLIFFIKWKYSTGQVFHILVLMIYALLISFPLSFTAIRTVPALINDPVVYDTEWSLADTNESIFILKGEDIDSQKYMSIERYFMFMFDRLGVLEDEDTEQASNYHTSSDLLLAYNDENALVSDLVKATSGAANEVSQDADEEDKSNGRLGIWQIYMDNLTLSGHEDMAIDSIAHAHNSYIQVAYDFGIIAGIVFLILCAYTLIKSVMVYMKATSDGEIYILLFALIVTFGMLSITELAFHPCIPAGFAFLMSIGLLMQKDGD